MSSSLKSFVKPTFSAFPALVSGEVNGKATRAMLTHPSRSVLQGKGQTGGRMGFDSLSGEK